MSDAKTVTEAMASTMDYSGLAYHFNKRNCRATLHSIGCQVVAGKSIAQGVDLAPGAATVLDALGCGHKVTICKCVAPVDNP